MGQNWVGRVAMEEINFQGKKINFTPVVGECVQMHGSAWEGSIASADSQMGPCPSPNVNQVFLKITSVLFSTSFATFVRW